MTHEAMDAETVAGLLGKSGISVRQLINYCSIGCPFEKRGRERFFNWHAVLEWYVAFKSGGTPSADLDDSPAPDTDEPASNKKESLTDANLRKTKAEADLKQLALARLRSQVIGVADARRTLDRMFGNLKSQLLGAAPLLNTRLEGEADSIARETAIREFMENLCRELATGKIVRDAEAATEPADDATGEELEPVDALDASAEDDNDSLVNRAVVEFLAANAAQQEVLRPC